MNGVNRLLKREFRRAGEYDFLKCSLPDGCQPVGNLGTPTLLVRMVHTPLHSGNPDEGFTFLKTQGKELLTNGEQRRLLF